MHGLLGGKEVTVGVQALVYPLGCAGAGWRLRGFLGPHVDSCAFRTLAAAPSARWQLRLPHVDSCAFLDSCAAGEGRRARPRRGAEAGGGLEMREQQG